MVRFPLFRRHILATPPLSDDMAVISSAVFLSDTDRPPFFPFSLGVSCRLRSLAVQRFGSGFEEPHLRLMFQFVESGFHEIPVFVHIRLIRVD